MTIFETAMGAQVPRRSLFKGAAAAGIGLALSGAGLLPLPGTPLDAVEAADSLQDILDATVTVEMFGITYLGLGIDSNAKGNFNPAIPAPVIAILQAARGQEQAHLEFFQGLGGKPLTQTFTLPNPALLTNPALYFDALQQEETRETAAHIAAMAVFTALQRPDLVKASFQYASEEAEHRLLANYAKGARPANDRAFAQALYANATDIIADLRKVGIIGGSGPAATFPGPGTVSFANVTERTPGGPTVACGPVANAAPGVAAPSGGAPSSGVTTNPGQPPASSGPQGTGTGGGGAAPTGGISGGSSPTNSTANQPPATGPGFIRRLGDG